MTDHQQTGLALALNAAATTDDDALRELVQGHLSAYSDDEAALIMAHAVTSLAGQVFRPILDATENPDIHRAQLAHTAHAIVHGPTVKEH